jgi:UPF0755 protein
MLDDLDLAWEDNQDPRRQRRGAPPSRQGRRQRRTERKRRRRSFGALFISFLLLAALGGGVYWGVGKAQDIFGAPDYTSVGTTTVNVKIPEGSGAEQIGELLQAKDVVKSAKAFVRAAAARDSESRNIQAGTYKLFVHMPAADALNDLLQPDKYLVSIKVLVPEGSTVVETFQILSKATGIPVSQFKDAAKDPQALGVPDWWYNRDDGKQADKSLEGFLFPDTYLFDPDANATDILKTMVNNFNTVIGDIKFPDNVQSSLAISPYEALIVASLAQAEAGNAADLPKVARVAYNRVFRFKDTFPCACLQFDVTANYWLEYQGGQKKPSKDLTPAELNDPKNPWNTAPGHPGLPIGPIDSPSKAALQAAMNPTQANWLYFVAIDKNGTTAFADNLQQQEANEAIARKNGVL